LTHKQQAHNFSQTCVSCTCRQAISRSQAA
jgi:hypothetical protein